MTHLWNKFPQVKPQYTKYYIILFNRGNWCKAYWNGERWSEGADPPGHGYNSPAYWLDIEIPDDVLEDAVILP